MADDKGLIREEDSGLLQRLKGLFRREAEPMPYREAIVPAYLRGYERLEPYPGEMEGAMEAEARRILSTPSRPVGPPSAPTRSGYEDYLSGRGASSFRPSADLPLNTAGEFPPMDFSRTEAPLGVTSLTVEPEPRRPTYSPSESLYAADRAAKIDQMIREMEEAQALEERLRALGR